MSRTLANSVREKSSPHASRGISEEAPLRRNVGAGGDEEDRGAPAATARVRRPEAPGHRSPLRLPARVEGRHAVVGGTEGAFLRHEGQAPRDAGRGPSLSLI